MSITSQFSGTCKVCKRTIAIGEQVDWVRGQGATCAQCARLTGRPVARPARPNRYRCSFCHQMQEGAPFAERRSTRGLVTLVCEACTHEAAEAAAKHAEGAADLYRHDCEAHTNPLYKEQLRKLAMLALRDAAFIRAHRDCLDPKTSSDCQNGRCGKSTSRSPRI